MAAAPSRGRHASPPRLGAATPPPQPPSISEYSAAREGISENPMAPCSQVQSSWTPIASPSSAPALLWAGPTGKNTAHTTKHRDHHGARDDIDDVKQWFPPRPHMGVALLAASEQSVEEETWRRNPPLRDVSPSGSRRAAAARASFQEEQQQHSAVSEAAKLAASSTLPGSKANAAADPVSAIVQESITKAEHRNSGKEGTFSFGVPHRSSSKEAKVVQVQSSLVARVTSDGARLSVMPPEGTRRPSWAVSSEGSGREGSAEPPVLSELPGFEDDYKTLKRRITRPHALSHTRVAC